LAREALQRSLAAGVSIEPHYLTAGADQRLFVVTEEAVQSMSDDFGRRPAWRADHRGAAGQGFDECEPEGLIPIDRHEKCPSRAKQFILGPVILLTDPFHERVAEQRPDLTFEVLLVGSVDPGRDLDRHTGLNRNPDRTDRILLRRDQA